MTQLQNITSKFLSSNLKGKLSAYGISHFAIFGSYARSEATKDSDLDVVLDLLPKNNITLWTLEEIENLLKEELSIPRVDFIMRRSMNPRLKPYIEKDIVTLF